MSAVVIVDYGLGNLASVRSPAPSRTSATSRA
jgi:hypothetical protein